MVVESQIFKNLPINVNNGFEMSKNTIVESSGQNIHQQAQHQQMEQNHQENQKIQLIDFSDSEPVEVEFTTVPEADNNLQAESSGLATNNQVPLWIRAVIEHEIASDLLAIESEENHAYLEAGRDTIMEPGPQRPTHSNQEFLEMMNVFGVFDNESEPDEDTLAGRVIGFAVSFTFREEGYSDQEVQSWWGRYVQDHPGQVVARGEELIEDLLSYIPEPEQRSRLRTRILERIRYVESSHNINVLQSLINIQQMLSFIAVLNLDDLFVDSHWSSTKDPATSLTPIKIEDYFTNLHQDVQSLIDKFLEERQAVLAELILTMNQLLAKQLEEKQFMQSIEQIYNQLRFDNHRYHDKCLNDIQKRSEDVTTANLK